MAFEVILSIPREKCWLNTVNAANAAPFFKPITVNLPKNKPRSKNGSQSTQEEAIVP
jgi:hypothetical protein